MLSGVIYCCYSAFKFSMYGYAQEDHLAGRTSVFYIVWTSLFYIIMAFYLFGLLPERVWYFLSTTSYLSLKGASYFLSFLIYSFCSWMHHSMLHQMEESTGMQEESSGDKLSSTSLLLYPHTIGFGSLERTQGMPIMNLAFGLSLLIPFPFPTRKVPDYSNQGPLEKKIPKTLWPFWTAYLHCEKEFISMFLKLCFWESKEKKLQRVI